MIIRIIFSLQSMLEQFSPSLAYALKCCRNDPFFPFELEKSFIEAPPNFIDLDKIFLVFFIISFISLSFRNLIFLVGLTLLEKQLHELLNLGKIEDFQHLIHVMEHHELIRRENPFIRLNFHGNKVVGSSITHKS